MLISAFVIFMSLSVLSHTAVAQVPCHASVGTGGADNAYIDNAGDPCRGGKNPSIAVNTDKIRPVQPDIIRDIQRQDSLTDGHQLQILKLNVYRCRQPTMKPVASVPLAPLRVSLSNPLRAMRVEVRP